MKFGRSALSPSRTRIPDYKSYGSLYSRWNIAHRLKTLFNPGFKFNCVNCSRGMAVSYDFLILQMSGWEERVGKDLADQAKEFYKVDSHGLSQDGGWPSMITVECPKCKTKHLVYAGINEPYNSAYHVTVQGITELLA